LHIIEKFLTNLLGFSSVYRLTKLAISGDSPSKPNLLDQGKNQTHGGINGYG
jgi:hypothetical protein